MQIILIGSCILGGMIIGAFFSFYVFKNTILSIAKSIAENLVEEMDKHYKRKF